MIDYLGALYIALYGLLLVRITSKEIVLINKLMLRNLIDSQKNTKLVFFNLLLFRKNANIFWVFLDNAGLCINKHGCTIMSFFIIFTKKC